MLMLRATFLTSTRWASKKASTASANPSTSDPIQTLFVNKIREYQNKKSKAGGKLVDASPETEAALKNELEKVAKVYGGGSGVDMTAFPQIEFKEPTVEPIDISSS